MMYESTDDVSECLGLSAEVVERGTGSIERRAPFRSVVGAPYVRSIANMQRMSPSPTRATTFHWSRASNLRCKRCVLFFEGMRCRGVESAGVECIDDAKIMTVSECCLLRFIALFQRNPERGKHFLNSATITKAKISYVAFSRRSEQFSTQTGRSSKLALGLLKSMRTLPNRSDFQAG